MISSGADVVCRCCVQMCVQMISSGADVVCRCCVQMLCADDKFGCRCLCADVVCRLLCADDKFGCR